MDKVAAVTGSEKSPPGGDTAPTMVTVPCVNHEKRYIYIFVWEGESVWERGRKEGGEWVMVLEGETDDGQLLLGVNTKYYSFEGNKEGK